MAEQQSVPDDERVEKLPVWARLLVRSLQTKLRYKERLHTELQRQSSNTACNFEAALRLLNDIKRDNSKAGPLAEEFLTKYMEGRPLHNEDVE
jgi:hypothetical protein